MRHLVYSTSKEREKNEEKREVSAHRKMLCQQYVDENFLWDIEGNRLSAAAIIGQDCTVWAQSSNFPQSAGGITIKKTNMALTPGQCNMIVERLGNYLIE